MNTLKIKKSGVFGLYSLKEILNQFK